MSNIPQYESAFPTSRRLHATARGMFPNGVTHDLRHLEPFPIYIDRAQGSRKWCVDGHELIDYWGGHGSLLLGHSHPAIVHAVQHQMERGTHPGACHELEIEWGRWVQRLVPAAERIRFTASGTEATLMALRLARMFNGKSKVLKFAGHFHGWHDAFCPGADHPHDGPVPGVPREVALNTVVIPPNDADLVDNTLRSDADIGSVILEPTGGHWGQVPIRGPFLKQLRDITQRHNRLLIFDEVITGFRVASGGAQEHYQVKPDLTALAKILAGGLPGGCVVGRGDIMAALEFRPGKPKMRHPGTFNANPLSAAAGIACLEMVANGEPCRRANDVARALRQRLNDLFADRNWPWVAYGEFSCFRLLPNYDGPRPSGDDFIPYGGELSKLDAPRDPATVYAFRRAMLLHGVDIPGLGAFCTAAHTAEDVDKTVAAVAHSLEEVMKSQEPRTK